jgi:hypothetical protein
LDNSRAGPNNAQDADAIAELESMCSQGYTLLAFPASAFGWLDLHSKFRKHLETQSGGLDHAPDYIVYQL